ncbi:SDR family oxidoreductase [Bacillus sp. FJAT-45350]|uniref:SDR family oxidoreductase n=1 Tax=Bacillus sp. FJAT-45350 TaxID=2011014 RepID=UPI000BB993BE|nr:SDR family oxidoreductase [Bacillus sp. FJAT-45350]
MERYKQVVCITGAGSGFGLDASLFFAKKGFQVVATVRSIERSSYLQQRIKEEGIEEKVDVVGLDVTKQSEIVRTITSILEKHQQIDILINNAGFAMGGFAEEISQDEWKDQFDTNFFGLVAVTQAVLPSMRKRSKGRIVNISSISGKIAFPGMSAYAASKHAVEAYSESLRFEVKPFDIDVCIVEPGSYQTNIWSKGKKVASRSVEPSSPYYKQYVAIENYLKKSEPNFGPTYEVTEVIFKACTIIKPKLRYPIGKQVKLLILLKGLLPWKLWERLVVKTMK